MQFISKALASQWDGVSLVELLDKSLSGWKPTRNFKVLHASQLTDNQVPFCAREAVILDLSKKPPRDRYISTAMQVAFDQGKSLHEYVRSEWLRDVAVGDWRCQKCGTMVRFSPHPKQCSKCGMDDYEYIEPIFVSQTTGVSGSMDTFINFALPKLVLTEIKTIDKDQFKALKAPLAEHRLRTILYLFLIRDSLRQERHKVDPMRAKILYVSKGFGAKGEDGKISPFREFDVTYNEDSILPYIEKALSVHAFRQKKAGVPKGICPTSYVNRVKYCACPKECWGPNYLEGSHGSSDTGEIDAGGQTVSVG